MIVWWTGDLLENTWGAFRLNAYYFLGMFFCVASALDLWRVGRQHVS